MFFLNLKKNEKYVFSNTRWGESGKAILHVSIAVFFRALLKYFSVKDGSAPPQEIIGPYAYRPSPSSTVI